MKVRELDDYVFISPGISTLESGVHLALTGQDFTLLPTRELVVQTGKSKNKIKVGFNSGEDLHLAVLNEAWGIFEYLREDDSRTLDEYFTPFGAFMKDRRPNIEPIREYTRLQFFQEYINGSGRKRNTVIKLYSIAASFLKTKMGQIMNNHTKKVNYMANIIEIEVELDGVEVGKSLIQETLDSFMAEMLDDEALIDLIQYMQIELNQPINKNIGHYVMYKGDVGDARLRELIRFAKANITVNTLESLGIDKRLNEQMPVIHQEGVTERDVHLVVAIGNVSSDEALNKTMLWMKRESNHNILYHALKTLPMVQDLPDEQIHGITDVDGNEISETGFIEDIEDGILEDRRPLEDPNKFSEYKNLFKDCSFKTIAELANTLLENGSLDVHKAHKENVKNPEELIRLFLGNDIGEVALTSPIGPSLEDLGRGLKNAVGHANETTKAIMESMDEVSKKLDEKGTNIKTLLEGKIRQTQTKLADIGQGLSIPATCGVRGEDEVHDELLKLTSSRYRDGLVANALRSTQITPLTFWEPGEELVEGVEVPHMVMQYLSISAKQVVERLSILTLTSNKDHFVKEYMELEDEETSEEITHRIDKVYKSIMEQGA